MLIEIAELLRLIPDVITLTEGNKRREDGGAWLLIVVCVWLHGEEKFYLKFDKTKSAPGFLSRDFAIK